MTRPSPRLSPRLRCIALAAAGLAATSAPAFAQTVDELTVYGRWSYDGEPRELSQAVSYRDLDLTTEAGRDVLKMRIKDTARALCRDLGENSASSVGPVASCQNAAVSDAMKQARVAFDTAVPRTYAVIPPASDASEIAYSEPLPPAAPTAEMYSQPASVTVQTVTNGAVADTPENRARYGGPMSNAGQRTTPAGN